MPESEEYVPWHHVGTTASSLANIGGKLIATKFSGAKENLWPEFKVELMALFCIQGTLEFVMKRVPMPSDPARQRSWFAALHLVFTTILFHVSQPAKGIVMAAGGVIMDGQAAFWALCEKFERTGVARLGALQQEMLKSTLKDGQDPDIVFTRMEELQQHFSLMQPPCPLPDVWMVAILMNNMPPSLKQLQMLMDQMEVKDFTKFKEQVRINFARKHYGKGGASSGGGGDHTPQALMAKGKTKPKAKVATKFTGDCDTSTMSAARGKPTRPASRARAARAVAAATPAATAGRQAVVVELMGAAARGASAASGRSPQRHTGGSRPTGRMRMMTMTPHPQSRHAYASSGHARCR
jgi:hypothetical protein